MKPYTVKLSSENCGSTVMFTNIFSECHWKCLLLPVMFTENISERHCAATVFTTQFLQCIIVIDIV